MAEMDFEVANGPVLPSEWQERPGRLKWTTLFHIHSPTRGSFYLGFFMGMDCFEQVSLDATMTWAAASYFVCVVAPSSRPGYRRSMLSTTPFDLAKKE